MPIDVAAEFAKRNARKAPKPTPAPTPRPRPAPTAEDIAEREARERRKAEEMESCRADRLRLEADERRGVV